MKAILCLIILCISLNSYAQKLITVEGACNKDVVSDRLLFKLTFESVDMSVKKAQDSVTKQASQVIKSIDKLGIKGTELTTDNYHISEKRQWQEKQSVLKGYQVRMSIKIVMTNFDRAGEVLAVAGKHQITNVSSFNYFLSDKKSKSVVLDCIDIAISDAKKKAEKLAKGTGSKVGEIFSIKEAGVPSVGPSPVRTEKLAVRSSVPNIVAGKNKLQYRAYFSFVLK